MKFHSAHTAIVNPPSASPVITQEQLWKALQQKARDPLRFVPVIETCDVIKEDTGGLTRVVTFKPGTGPPGKITEVVVFAGQVKADFYMEDIGTSISNIISLGDGGDTDMYLTFTFTWNFPEIQEGSEEATTKAKQLTEVSKNAAAHTVKQVREMLKDKSLV
ncbi:hypothetical protein PHLCEN_2v1340 [Hermanssonia centrifuga]|uniref:DUF1857-domain-containing protein n=1 Tax=Hermanssonia centrifuga TaxID=98765 RepID=A0A2R6S3D8_9APHY|nr:hypothetical protein PHLCEN_2v1340 [Hermanssonia centrifuga]